MLLGRTSDRERVDGTHEEETYDGKDAESLGRFPGEDSDQQDRTQNHQENPDISGSIRPRLDAFRAIRDQTNPANDDDDGDENSLPLPSARFLIHKAQPNKLSSPSKRKEPDGPLPP